jgi:hypothetical protein
MQITPRAEEIIKCSNTPERGKFGVLITFAFIVISLIVSLCNLFIVLRQSLAM